MKKLFSAISVILCMVMLTVSAAAATATSDEVNTRDILRKAASKSIAIETLELRGVLRETSTIAGEPYSSVMAMEAKFDDLSGNASSFKGGLLAWTSSDKFDMQMYVKDGYIYDSGTRERTKLDYDSSEYQVDAKDAYQAIVMLLFSEYGIGLDDVTAEKAADGGYLLKYKLDGSRLTIALDENYIIKSFSVISKDDYDDSKTTIRFDIIINEPVDIVFPYDLYTYKTVS